MKLFYLSTSIFILAAGAQESQAFQTPAQSPLPNLDRRAGAAAKSEQQAAAQSLRARLPKARVDFDAITGSPLLISAEDSLLTGPGGRGAAVPDAAIAAIAATDTNRTVKAFLKEHRQLFGYGPEALEQARVKREFTSTHSGLRTVIWEQHVQEIPVFEAVLVAHTTDRKSTRLNSS